MAAYEHGRPAPSTAPQHFNLFALPPELFRSIWDFLPPYSRVCFSLTCHYMYNLWFRASVKEIDLDRQAERFQRGPREMRHQLLYLLRRLRNDLKDKSLFLCHACLCFHSLDFTAGSLSTVKEKQVLRKAPIFGFCCIDTPTAMALLDIQDRLDNPRDRGFTRYTGGYIGSSPVRLSNEVLVGPLGLCLRTAYGLADDTEESTGIPPSDDFAEVVLNSNIEFCQHLCLGFDYVPGDRSMSDEIQKWTERSQPRRELHAPFGSWEWQFLGSTDEWPEFSCKDCGVNVKVTTAVTGVPVGLLAWRYFERGRRVLARIQKWESEVFRPLESLEAAKEEVAGENRNDARRFFTWS